MFIGFELAKTSVSKILSAEAITFDWMMFGILGASVLVKGWMWLFYSRLAKSISSEALKASGVDSRNDVLMSLAVLAGCVISKLTGFELDGYIGLGVAVFILYSGVRLARQTISPLLGERADKNLEEKIRSLVLAEEKVLGLHDLLVHDYGPGKCYASVHVEFSAAEDHLECHDIIDAIEWTVLEQLNVHLVIHYDPVVENDAEWNEMQRTVQAIIESIEPSLSMHDFRIARGAKEAKLIFDLAVPYALSDRRREYKQRIEDALREKGKHYTLVVRFDRK